MPRCKLSLRNPVYGGARGDFHLPVRQAILRVASRRIRSDILPRRRVGESARGVLECTLQQACPVLDTGKDDGNAADACLPVGRAFFKQPVEIGNFSLEKKL